MHEFLHLSPLFVRRNNLRRLLRRALNDLIRNFSFPVNQYREKAKFRHRHQKSVRGLDSILVPAVRPLRQDKIIKMDGFGEKSYDKMINTVNEAKLEYLKPVPHLLRQP